MDLQGHLMVFLDSTGVWPSCLAKTGFQFLCYYVWFLQIQSHIFILLHDTHVCLYHSTYNAMQLLYFFL